MKVSKTKMLVIIKNIINIYMNNISLVLEKTTKKKQVEITNVYLLWEILKNSLLNGGITG